ncbi:hypothetical protein SAMN05216406_1263 [Nitrosomonas ureae]|uniref:Uncharacterized protein n=1 Tax=Nitrosomonas ureae TaxID=44577 RepID=A0A1H2FYB4_9PROT|nr:hypothetical protein C8R27_10473 [Nitrosomonas ureae]SDU12366.1 hypothetical protein SAMN05216406_1263 [Nitrosomonas ureae]
MQKISSCRIDIFSLYILKPNDINELWCVGDRVGVLGSGVVILILKERSE